MRGLFGSAAHVLGFLVLLACSSDGLAALPNLLVIVADDLGTDSLELYEGFNDHTNLAPSPDSPYWPLFDGAVRYPRTPTIDDLARRGLLFTRAWSGPTCTPTRTTILAGRHPRAALTGVSALHRTPVALSPHEWTIPEVLDLVTGGRYATAVIGKWHLGSCIAGGLDAPRSQAGFDYFAGTLKNLTGSLLDKGDTDCRVGPCAQHCQACQASGYLRWCRIESAPEGTRSSLQRVESCGEGCRPPDYPASRKVDDAVAWIAQQTRPWFLYLAFHLPHGQFHVPPFALLSEATVGRMKERGWPELALSRTVCPTTKETDLIRCRREMYLAMIEAMDTEIGRLLRALSGDPVALDLGDTTVIFVGDNGTPRKVIDPDLNHPARAKRTLSEGGVHVPFIIAGHGVHEPNRSSDALAHTIDIYATLAELAAQRPVAIRSTASRSLVPLMRGEAGQREFVFTDAQAGSFWLQQTPPVIATVRDDRYKLLRAGSGTWKFYDLARTEGEDIDLRAGGGDCGASAPHEACFGVPDEEEACARCLRLLDALESLVEETQLATCPRDAVVASADAAGCPFCETRSCRPGDADARVFDTGRVACRQQADSLDVLSVLECDPGTTIQMLRCACALDDSFWCSNNAIDEAGETYLEPRCCEPGGTACRIPLGVCFE